MLTIIVRGQKQIQQCPLEIAVPNALDQDLFFVEMNRYRHDPQQISKIERTGRTIISTRLTKPPRGFVREIDQLRLYIDEWLDTGRTADGVENPTNRDLTRAPNAWAALQRAQPVASKIIWTGKGPRVEVTSWISDSNLKTLFPPFHPAGKADHILGRFFLSEWHGQIAKCRAPLAAGNADRSPEESFSMDIGQLASATYFNQLKCGRYFLLSHLNRTYKSGTFCQDCIRERTLESAKAITARNRETVHLELVQLVARRFARRIQGHADWHKDVKLKENMADFLRGRIQQSAELQSIMKTPVTRKWVSRSSNWKAINAALQKEKYAKS